MRGEIKEYLAFNEFQARETEKNAATSWFPQQYWEAAAASYHEAATAARLSGQLQKSIALGEKALEMAEKSKEPVLQLQAINELIGGYSSVRNFEKPKGLIQKGFAILEKTPDAHTRNSWGSGLYLQLGIDLMREREYEKAIDAFSQSLRLEEDAQAFRYRVIRNQSSIESGKTNIVSRLTHLGDAYRRAGKLGDVPQTIAQSPAPLSVSTSHPYFWAPFILVGDGR